MRKNKFVKVLEGILLSLPLLYVGVTSFYVINNKNAYESYADYDEVISNRINTTDNFEIGSTYYVNYKVGDNTQSPRFMFSDISLDLESITSTTTQYVGFAFVGSTFRLYDSSLNTYDVTNYWGDDLNTFTFVFSSLENVQRWSLVSNYAIYSRYFVSGSLSSVFPYALSQFNELGFNKIPFTSFFTNIFHNGETNVYIDFLNSYLNYMLLVECTYVVPMVLYWFIHIGENILERFIHKEF